MVIHSDFIKWCATEDIEEMSLKEFVQTLRQKKLLIRDRVLGHCIKGYKIKSVKHVDGADKASKVTSHKSKNSR